jgi:hypothetical protein
MDGEVEDGGSTKVFVSEKGFRRRTELALKILRRATG